MTKPAMIIILSVFLALAGCADSEKAELKKQVEQLKEKAVEVAQMKAEAAQSQARLDATLSALLSEDARLNRAAYWAAWCDYIVPTCSTAAVAEGRALIKAGRIVEGVGVSKIIALIFGIGVPLLILLLVWVFLHQPAKADIERAREEIAGAKTEAEKILRKARADADHAAEVAEEAFDLLEIKRAATRKKLKMEIDGLYSEKKKVIEDLRELHQKIEASERKVVALETQVQELERVRNAFR